MSVPALAVTPLRAPRGRAVHATSPDPARLGRTACGRRADRWIVTSGPITCAACGAVLEGTR